MDGISECVIIKVFYNAKKKKLIIILAQMKTKTDQISGKQEEGRLGANFQEILYKMKVSDMS